MSRKYPLPEGVEDAVLNRTQLSQAFGVSTNTIDRWRMEGMPVLREGTNGTSYEFQLSACWAWKCRRDEEEQQRDEEAARAVSQMRLALVGGGLGDSERALSPRERAELYELEIKFNAAARERRELILVSEVVELLESLFVVISDSIDALPDVLERECGLDGRQVARTVQACDTMLDEVRRRIEASQLSRPSKPKRKANGTRVARH